MIQRKTLGMLFGCVLFGGLAAPARGQQCKAPITAAEVERAEDARYVAQTTGDFKAMERIFDEDLVYTHSSAVTDSKASYLESLRSGATKYRAMRRSETRVRTWGCVAAITGVADFDLTSKGQDTSVKLRFQSLWVKRPDGLHFVSWNSTRIPPKE